MGDERYQLLELKLRHLDVLSEHLQHRGHGSEIIDSAEGAQGRVEVGMLWKPRSARRQQTAGTHPLYQHLKRAADRVGQLLSQD
jgi:hypothetical protein